MNKSLNPNDDEVAIKKSGIFNDKQLFKEGEDIMNKKKDKNETLKSIKINF